MDIDIDRELEDPHPAAQPIPTIRIPPRRRFQPLLDALPEQIPGPSLSMLPLLGRRVNLIVRDTLRTEANRFGLWREYPYRPSFDPDSFVPPADLAQSNLALDELHQQNLRAEEAELSSLHTNRTWGLLTEWRLTGSDKKSFAEMARLVKDYLLDPDFKIEELKGYNPKRVEDEIDAADSTRSILDGFKETSIPISIPSGDPTVPPKVFEVPGFYYRPLISLIRLAFAHPLAAQLHFSPFRLWQTSPINNVTQRVYSEVYDSDAFIDEHEKVQRLRDIPDRLERVVAAMMIWSDSTHLTNFGVANMWPIYLCLGNLSKYIRALPNSGALQHVAYIPSLSDAFQDRLKAWYTKWDKPTHRKDLMAHCKRELMHALWKFLLSDEEFMHAYRYGIVIKCLDGIERRIFPRLFTYSADYPEK